MKISRLLFIALLLTAACRPDIDVAEAPVDAEFARLESRAANVEIIRDDYGVPHIYAKTDADAVFGMLYAQAEDDFPRIERNYIWATGRLAEIDGEAAIFSDVRAHLYMKPEEAIAAYESAPGWLKDLCDAFADGLNYYLATHPDEPRQLLERFEPWMPMYFFEGSIGGDIEQIPLTGIAEFYGGRSLEPLVGARHAGDESPVGARHAGDEPPVGARHAGDESPVGARHAGDRAHGALLRGSESVGARHAGDRPLNASNGFAIAGDRTASGNTLLLINPHTSFYFRGESHVVSEEGLNAYGASTWGQFFIYQGFNENTGWMHTSTYVDFMDEFVEDISDVDGKLTYRYGDEQRPVESWDVTLKYKDGDTVRERTFTLYRTHHGPITHQIHGDWVATKINWDPVNALAQSFTRTKTQNYDEFRDMMNIRTNSSNNTVFADSEGNIAYFHGNFVPRRDSSLDFSMPVDGSDPGTDWQGLHTVDETITLLNPPNGWIQNANSTPFTAAAEHSPNPEDYPAYMAPDAENFRGVNAVRLLTGINDLTLDGLIELSHDTYLPGFEQILRGLIVAYDTRPDPALAEPIELLRNWDRRSGFDSVAMTLAHFYARNAEATGAHPDGLSQMQRVNWYGSRFSPGERLRVFAETIAMLEADFGSWQTPWGDVNRFQRLSGDIDLQFDDEQPSVAIGLGNSDWGALADFGSRRQAGTRKLYGVNGNSFAAVVEFGEQVRAKSILVGGQSNDPDSGNFTDQVERYVNADWKEVAYYREDVEARAVRRYRPGETN